MSLIGFAIFALVAFVAGVVYNWVVPQVTPHLPSQVQSNMVLRSLATGAFILVSIAIAHVVAKLVAGKRAKRVVG